MLLQKSMLDPVLMASKKADILRRYTTVYFYHRNTHIILNLIFTHHCLLRFALTTKSMCKILPPARHSFILYRIYQECGQNICVFMKKHHNNYKGVVSRNVTSRAYLRSHTIYDGAAPIYKETS